MDALSEADIEADSDALAEADIEADSDALIEADALALSEALSLGITESLNEIPINPQSSDLDNPKSTVIEPDAPESRSYSLPHTWFPAS